MVAFIHDDQIRRYQSTGATDYSLHTHNLHVRQRIDRPARSNDAVLNANVSHRSACLLHKLGAVNENPDAFIFLACAISDIRKHNGFTGASRRNNKWGTIAFTESLPNIGNDVGLVRAKNHEFTGTM